jgi:hypothetical protein
MSSYETVVEMFTEVPSLGLGSEHSPYAQNRLMAMGEDREAVSQVIAVGRSVHFTLRGTESTFAAIQDELDTTPTLRANVERFSSGQLNPFDVGGLATQLVMERARDLSVGRKICELMPGKSIDLPEPLLAALPQGTGLTQQAWNLHGLSHDIWALHFPRVSRFDALSRAHRLVERAGLDEQQLARIGLSELEPDWISHKLRQSSDHRLVVASAASLLASSRRIAKSMTTIVISQTRMRK